MEQLDVVIDGEGSGPGERGAGVVEWLGISALSIALLATIFTALNAVGLDLVDYIRATLGI